MLRIGLTGGIGAGKSTVARRLSELGAVLIDADLLAREVVEPGSEALDEIVAAFGPGVLRPDGSLDRPAVAASVFADEELRSRLNAIVHPRVGARTEELVARAPPDAVVVQDVPLLVENDLGARFELVVVVHAPADVRVRRLVTDRGATEADARARIATQAQDTARRAAADVWLDNSGPVGGLLAAVDTLWRDRIRPFEENLRQGRTVALPRERVPSDPRWPAQAARAAARIRRACGPRVVRVDHVGPSAVPGLPAPDVLDLDVCVAGSAGVRAVAGSLSMAGFSPCPGTPGGPAAPGDGRRDRLVVHGSSDPGRPLRLSVHPVGDPAGARAQLLRDWLRAVPQMWAGYLEAPPDVLAPGSKEVPEAAREWVRQTGWRPAT